MVTNLLRQVQNIHWSEHATKERTYDSQPPISDTLMRRRLQFAGHCLRVEREIISSLLLWNQRLPIRNRKTTYPQSSLSRGSGIEVGKLGQGMRNRTLWHAVVASIPASDAEGWWWRWKTGSTLMQTFKALQDKAFDPRHKDLNNWQLCSHFYDLTATSLRG